ncbi:MAG: hypothetical protein JRI92_09785, partial [Deltaproteobacteria bacterium]|nr:hypothetical protein [Deltaproteobacteria bacterium]
FQLGIAGVAPDLLKLLKKTGFTLGRQDESSLGRSIGGSVRQYRFSSSAGLHWA